MGQRKGVCVRGSVTQRRLDVLGEIYWSAVALLLLKLAAVRGQGSETFPSKPYHWRGQATYAALCNSP